MKQVKIIAFLILLASTCLSQNAKKSHSAIKRSLAISGISQAQLTSQLKPLTDQIAVLQNNDKTRTAQILALSKDTAAKGVLIRAIQLYDANQDIFLQKLNARMYYAEGQFKYDSTWILSAKSQFSSLQNQVDTIRKNFVLKSVRPSNEFKVDSSGIMWLNK